MCRPMQTMRFSIVCLPSAKGAHDFRKEVPPHRLRAPEKSQTLWEGGRATKRMSFRIYAEENDVAFALTRW